MESRDGKARLDDETRQGSLQHLTAREGAEGATDRLPVQARLTVSPPRRLASGLKPRLVGLLVRTIGQTAVVAENLSDDLSQGAAVDAVSVWRDPTVLGISFASRLSDTVFVAASVTAAAARIVALAYERKSGHYALTLSTTGI